MTLVMAFVLGLVQGVAEFLPISSSAHLVLVPELLGWPEQPITFDVAVHVATLLAVFIALRSDIIDILRRLLARDRAAWRFAGVIVLATLPAVAFGALGGDVIDAARTPKMIAIMLVIWSLLLSWADIVSRRMRKTITDPTAVSAAKGFVIGAVQALALMPGVSRSGGTLTTGIFLGLSREAAVKFSFLLGIPAILGAAAMTVADVAKTGLDVAVAPLAVGFITALVTGILAIRLLLVVARQWSLHVFTVYRIILAAIVWLVLVK